MQHYYYSVIRYVADVVQGDSVNVGIIVVSDTDRDGICRISSCFQNAIRSIDPLANVELIGRLLTNLSRRTGATHQSSMFNWEDDRITSSGHLGTLAGALRNQIQLTAPVLYLATSLRTATCLLYENLVRCKATERTNPEGMTLEQLNSLL